MDVSVGSGRVRCDEAGWCEVGWGLVMCSGIEIRGEACCSRAKKVNK